MFNKHPNFTMFVGLPGSGKSTWCEPYERNPKCKVISSDAIRKELYGDENCQNNPQKVFDIMKERTLDALDKGYDVAYDATNIIRKFRVEFLKCLPSYVNKIAFICWAPLEVCIERDSKRDRTVGKAVIDKMVRRWETPYYDEGWDLIYLNRSAVWDPVKYRENLVHSMDIPQDNPHHTLSVLNHCTTALELYDRMYVTTTGNVPFYYCREAVLFHDCGKPYTKTFVNKKGESTDVAHYYSHENVGAYFIFGLFPGGADSDAIYASWLVNSHMCQFINEKYYKSLPTYLKEQVNLIHEADKLAH